MAPNPREIRLIKLPDGRLIYVDKDDANLAPSDDVGPLRVGTDKVFPTKFVPASNKSPDELFTRRKRHMEIFR